MLVSKCRIYDEDIMASFSYYKSMNERNGKNQYRGKLYNASSDRGK